MNYFVEKHAFKTRRNAARKVLKSVCNSCMNIDVIQFRDIALTLIDAFGCDIALDQVFDLKTWICTGRDRLRYKVSFSIHSIRAL
jgi:hypothetical protein